MHRSQLHPITDAALGCRSAGSVCDIDPGNLILERADAYERKAKGKKAVHINFFWHSYYELKRMTPGRTLNRRLREAACPHSQNGELVAQFKATVLLMPNGSDRVTSAPLQKVETDKKVKRQRNLPVLQHCIKCLANTLAMTSAEPPLTPHTRG